MEQVEQTLREIEAAANAGMVKTREIARCGPFNAYFDPLMELIWLNYAAPVTPITSEAQVHSAMRDLRAEFARRNRRVRFEFIEPLWPTLGEMLLREGLVLQANQPLMVCTPDSFRPRVMAELRIHELSKSDDDQTLTTFSQTAADGFEDMDQPIPIEELRHRLRVELQSNMRFAVIGWIGDEPAGVAALSPMGATAELVGVATLPRFRNRGIAQALCSYLVSAHFERGSSGAWLSAQGAVAQAVYHRLGFQDAGVYANYIAPESSSSAAEAHG